ncbi:MAG: hypothetical protein K0R68_4007, partial [Mycobacterium sp.]|nr:hypothetical protein [Mycobacterium sp.]
MSHHDGRCLRLAQQSDDVLPYAYPQPRIQCGEGFVEEQHARPGGQCASQGDTLLLASRQFMRASFGVLLHVYDGQPVGDFGGRIRAQRLTQAEGDVARDAAVGKQRTFL